ncbi:winged helix-turn-helix domain-containing protein [Methanothrix sp.]|uniref:winged helix-turn-helix domain-containing protein n=1 Tax=Methanothrix sp. TaxID=90426 RepID=UPI001BD50EEF
MARPFEGVFGDSSELKVIQFLLPLSDLEFNISEIARNVGVSRQTLVPVIKKLTKWNVLKVVSRHGNAKYYAMNKESGFIEAFENLNNRIIEQMLGEETLSQIEQYCREHSPMIIPLREEINSLYVTDNPDSPEKRWMQFNSVNVRWVEIPPEQSNVMHAKSRKGETYANAGAA